VHEAGHSPLPSAEVKNECIYVTTPSICMHGVERDTLPFFNIHL